MILLIIHDGHHVSCQIGDRHPVSLHKLFKGPQGWRQQAG